MISLDNLIIKGILKTVKKNHMIDVHFNFSYKTQKYKLEDILPFIIDILKYGFPWRYLKKVKTEIHWSTIYCTYIKLVSFGVFKDTYIKMVRAYIKKTPNKKLKHILSDTMTIYNKYNRDTVKRNGYNKNKNVIKISPITDLFGIPLKIDVFSGNTHDSTILQKQLDEDLYICNQIVDKNKKYLLADKAYDSVKLRDKLIDKGYKPIIDYNIRNTKDKKLIRKFTKKEEEIYKKRIKVENLFAKIKMRFNRLNFVNECKIKNYVGFLFLSLCFIIKTQQN